MMKCHLLTGKGVVSIRCGGVWGEERVRSESESESERVKVGGREGQTPRCYIRWGGPECRGAGFFGWPGIRGLAVGWVSCLLT